MSFNSAAFEVTAVLPNATMPSFSFGKITVMVD